MLQKQKASHILIDFQINRKEKQVKKRNNEISRFQREKDELIQELLNSKIPQRDVWKKRCNVTNIQTDQEVIEVVKNYQKTQRQIKKVYYLHHLLRQQQDLTKRQLKQEKRYDEYVTQAKNRKLKNQYVDLIEIQSDSQESYQILDHFIKKKSPNYKINSNIQPSYIRVTSKINENSTKSDHNFNAEVQTNNETTMIISKFYRSELSQHKKIRKTETKIYKTSKSPIQIDTSHQKLSQKRQQRKEKSQSTINKNSYKIAKKENIVSIPQFDLFKYSTSNHRNKQQYTQNQCYQKYQPKEGNISKSNLSQQKVQGKTTNEDKSNKKSRNKYQNIIQILQKEPAQNIDTPKINQNENNYDQSSNIFTKIDQKRPISQIRQTEVKEIFKIKDQQTFKKIIQQQDSRYNPNNKILPKKAKIDIFNGCVQLSYRKMSKHFQTQPVRQQKKKLNQKNNIKKQNDNHKQGKIQQIRPQNIKTHSQFKQLSSIINKEVTIQKEHVIKPQKIQQVSMRQDDLQKINIKNAESSSSGSLVKEQLNDNQMNKISKITSDIVNKVTSKIQKSISNQGSFVKSNPQPTITPSKDNKISTNQDLIKKRSTDNNGKMQQSQTISIMKIFGQPKDTRKQQNSQSIDFFANCDVQSNPSSVKQISSKSEDKSQMMKHIKDLQSYSIDSQIFKKNSEIVGQQSFNQVHKPQISYEPIYESISQWRPNHLNHSKMEELNISQDALSLSKFPDASQSKDFQNTKVKRMEILQESESDAQRVLSQTSSDSNIEDDINQLQNYQSDQQQPIKPKQKYQQRFTKALTPVLQQDLEQSQYHRLENKKKISKFQIMK